MRSLPPRPFERLALAAGAVLLGRRFGGLLRELEGDERLAPEELDRRSENRLRRILVHAVRRVPFWREAARSAGIADAVEDPDARPSDLLRRLPVIDKATFRSRPAEAFLAEGVSPHRRLPYATSGSTGEPFRFHLDRAAMPLVYASHLHFDRAFGIGPFDRCVRVMPPGSKDEPLSAAAPLSMRVREVVGGGLYRLHERLTQRRLNLFEVTPESALRLRDWIEDFRADVLLGYTSSLATAAEYLLEKGLRVERRLKAVVAIAENLTPERRRLIEEVFPAPIANRYGQREFKFWCAQSCEASCERFHVHPSLVFAETVDAGGAPCAAGEVGRLVLTHLHNFVQPFLRYDTGDLARLEPAAAGACPCGRSLPTIAELSGRSLECFRSPSGRFVPPVSLGHYLFVVQGWVDRVRHFQLIQEADDAAVLCVVPAGPFDDEDRAALARDLSRLLGDDVRVRVEIVSEIPLERSGKRPIIKRLQGATESG